MSSASSPLMDQYRKIKGQNPDAILFFRVGDFYEMFFDDARVASRELEITLTARGKDGDDPIPLAGVPYHAYEEHASRLLKRGFKVALCEQVGDPKATKGLVERQVVRVLTPGTITDEHLLTGASHNYLLGISRRQDRWALAYLDLSTGDAHITGLAGAAASERLLEEILRIRPAELVYPIALKDDPMLVRVREALALPDGALNAIAGAQELWQQALPDSLAAYSGQTAEPEKEDVLRMLVGYVHRTQGGAFEHFSRLASYTLDDTMSIDPGTVRNLELVETLREKAKRGSLLWVLDRTKTAMGGRLLRRWLLYPLVHVPQIQARLDAVERLVRSYTETQEAARSLSGIHDIPRILAKVSARNASPRDLSSLGNSLAQLPALRDLARGLGQAELAGRILSFDGLAADLTRSLAEPAPVLVSEGGIFREGIAGELDRLRNMDREAKGMLGRIEGEERERTGIKSLKIKYNRVLGYFIEVTKSNLGSVPDNYHRKQGMAGGERFVTPELKEKESEILRAEERARGLEHDMFLELRAQVEGEVQGLKSTAEALAELDALVSLALVAVENDYVRPTFASGRCLRIQAGRHPVVEKMLSAGTFVPNDLLFSDSSSQIAILTGPNMAGKSTFLRQAALLTVMAQMGSFVPAKAMELEAADKVFTRVGASDDLASGQSTFMVEMKETSYILKNATSASLVILDEVGRGTSTYDGLSLAWAILESLHTTMRPRTLFATHYHELTELAGLFPGIANLSTKVLEKGDSVVFLHKVGEGFADKSYGIHVAMLAGLPDPVLMRAREILFELEQDEERDLAKKRKRLARGRPERDAEQQLLFDVAVHPAVEELRKTDVNSLTPLAALNLLARLRTMV